MWWPTSSKVTQSQSDNYIVVVVVADDLMIASEGHISNIGWFGIEFVRSNKIDMLSDVPYEAMKDLLGSSLSTE